MALAPTAASVAHKMQAIKGERHLFSSSDDAVVMKQILATHAPDGRQVDARPLLRVVEDVLQKATPTVVVPQQTHMELLEDKMHQVEVIGMPEALANTIHKLSCEITCKCSGSGDAHATTLALFNTLSNYTWDAKIVLAVATFAVSYGEFWLTAQLHTVNPLAKSVALLKQMPDILEQTDVLKHRFDAINAVIKAMLDVTRCIIELAELPEYNSSDIPDMALALGHIPTAVYWTIRSIISCADNIIALIGMGRECIISTTEAWELTCLAHKVNNIYGHLTEQLALRNQYTRPNALIQFMDKLPLVEGSTKRRVNVDHALWGKIVMLFISDLDISDEELFVLIQIYNDTHQGKVERNYEIIWLPVADQHVPWLPAKEETFNRLASTMPWYLLNHPSLLEPASTR